MAKMEELRTGLANSPPARFRGRWATTVSLISDFYPLDRVGNFAGGKRNDGNYEESGWKCSKWKK